MKDIFIDNNVSKNFANPMDPHYKELVEWLIEFDPEDRAINAHLVVSNKLLQEYTGSSGLSLSTTSILMVIAKMQREGRILKVSNEQIKSFQKTHFKKAIEKKLRSNRKDRDHLPIVLLSHRKYALTIDDNFSYDLTHFPGFRAIAAKRPEKLQYRD